MKTTVNVSLNGRAFTIEEDAYTLLKNYLNDIKLRLKENPDAAEIIYDVESRASELLISKITSSSQVVNHLMINNIISTIGAPHYFGEYETSNEKKETPPTYKYVVIEEKQRLLRDGDRRIFGGVCSGIASYFGSDISLVRILALILIFCMGIGLIPYLIMWIIVPKAVTPAEKEMVEKGYNK